MHEINNLKNNNSRVPVANSQLNQQLITLKGITTSQVQQALKADNPYPARVFLKVDNQEQDIPVFFRIKENNNWIKPKLKKGSYLEVHGNWSENKENTRPSFTTHSYQLLNPQYEFKQEVFNKDHE